MVKKKTTAKTTAKTTRRRASRTTAAPRRRRTKTGVSMIPAAAATVGLAYANKDYLKYTMTVLTNGSKFDDKINWAMRNYPNMLKSDRLVKDAVYMGAAYLGGSVIQKYAPSVIKKPLGAISKKIPRIRGL